PCVVDGRDHRAPCSCVIRSPPANCSLLQSSLVCASHRALPFSTVFDELWKSPTNRKSLHGVRGRKPAAADYIMDAPAEAATERLAALIIISVAHLQPLVESSYSPDPSTLGSSFRDRKQPAKYPT